MTAGIFAKHGVWVGPCRGGDSRNEKGYFESAPFKKALIEKAGRITEAGELAARVPGWKEGAESILERSGYNGGPWLVKHSAMYYPLWHDFDAKYICVRRDIDSIRRSGKASGYLKSAGAIKNHVDAMDYVRDNLGGVDVFTDEIISGDYSSLRRAFSHVGLAMTKFIVDDFVDPSLWHY